MATLGSLVVELGADVGRLQSDMNRATSIAQRGAQQIRRAGALAATAFSAAGGIFAGLIKSSADLADELGKTAQRAGVTVESLSALNYAAKLSDVDTAQLAGGLQKLARTMADAAGGSSQAIESFRALGIEFVDANGKLRSTDVVFTEIADKFSKLPDGATKTALAMRLLGRSGADMIPLLNAGAAGLATYREEAERLGLIMSTETAKAAEELNDNITRLNAAMQGLTLALTKDAIAGLANVTTEFVKAYTEGEGLLRVFEALGTAISRVTAGNDQEQLGKLLLQEIDLEQRIAKIQNSSATERGKTRALAGLRAELAEVRRQAEGLRTVLQPYQFGAGARPSEAAPAAAVLPSLADPEAAERARAAAAKVATQAERERFRVYNAAVNETLSQIEEEARQWEDIDRRRQAAVDAQRTPLELQIDKLKELDALLGSDNDTYGRAAIDAFNELNPALDQADDKAKRLQTTFADLGATFSSAFEEAIFSASSFSDVLAGLGQDIARLLLRQTVTDPISNFFSTQFGAGGGGFSGIFSSLFGGFRASGGPVSAGRAYVVGERGPELLIPGTAGTVVPNGAGSTVNVFNYGSEPVRTEDNGTRGIDVFVGSSVSRAASRGMMAPLGIRPPLVAR